MEVREQKLPSEEEWRIAVERSQALFGMAIGQVRNAANVNRMSEGLKAESEKYLQQVTRLAGELIARIPWSGGNLETAPRSIITAEANRLLAAVHQARGSDVVKVLAQAPLTSPLQEVGIVIKSAERVLTVLRTTNWDILEGIRILSDDRREAAQGIARQLKVAFESGPLVVDLAAELERLGRDATRLLIQAAVPTALKPAAPGVSQWPASTSVQPAGISAGAMGLTAEAPAAVTASAASSPRGGTIPAWSPNDSEDVEAFYRGNPSARQRHRSIVDELKCLYGRSQASGDHGLDSISIEDMRGVLEVHHIVPLSQGGADNWSNMVVLTPTLHALVHAHPGSSIDLRSGVLHVAGATLPLQVHPDHQRHL
jgi:hypothetical protein